MLEEIVEDGCEEDIMGKEEKGEKKNERPKEIDVIDSVDGTGISFVGFSEIIHYVLITHSHGVEPWFKGSKDR